MTMNRRDFLKQSSASLGGLMFLPLVDSNSSGEINEDCYGVLYDATKCIGCRECETACKGERDLEIERDEDLDADTWTLIKLYQNEEQGSEYSFVKRNCMHCIDPACVSACPVGAMQKTPEGPVIYDETIRIG